MNQVERAGFGYGIAAYAFWGFAPLAWRLMHAVPADELIALRVAWGCVWFVGLSVAFGKLAELRAVFASRADVLRLSAAAVCIAGNWLIFVYAVMNDHVLDVSLGYFINPLVNVALGRFALGERLRPLQVAAVAVASIGVLIVATGSGGVPWISLGLAGSFAIYGLLRKTTEVPPLAGSATETLVLLPFALGLLVWLGVEGQGHMFAGSVQMDLLLLLAGPLTAIPLLLFVNAARRLPMTSLGFLQYLAPSIQFVVAIVWLEESAEPARLAAFATVWIALVLFSVDAWRRRGPSPRAA